MRSPRALRAQAREARHVGHRAVELEALLALAEVSDLHDDERSRMAILSHARERQLVLSMNRGDARDRDDGLRARRPQPGLARASLVTSDGSAPTPALLTRALVSDAAACLVVPGTHVSASAWIETTLRSVALSPRTLPCVEIAAEQLAAAGDSAQTLLRLLIKEDPQRPEVLVAAALVEGAAGRSGLAARHLIDARFFTTDRRWAWVREARVWERLGMPRSSCAAWGQVARFSAVADPLHALAWQKVLACAEQDPGFADAAEVRRHLQTR